jgi:hypothetical protein
LAFLLAYRFRSIDGLTVVPAFYRLPYVANYNCCRQQQSSNLASVSQSNMKNATYTEKRRVDQDSPIQDCHSGAPRKEEHKKERSSF